jgi:hypothetical protein
MFASVRTRRQGQGLLLGVGFLMGVYVLATTLLLRGL